MDQRERDILDYLRFLSNGIWAGTIHMEYFIVDEKIHRAENESRVHDGYNDGTTIELMYKLTMPSAVRDDET